ncbi:hypothetical protein B0T10DRAFT_495357 [Thelonectria olida]|uniref:DUF6594 domain-containing protein n=1 Tax=Thelonectria olida TaxID=1576542 RepID=A0A9P8VWB3_9HYPO|nr:hypothetical protein B0T10DRAFT_495357 [Thelonectria olida]
MNKQNQRFHIDGFPSLAAFVSSDIDGTSAIFKRFNQLAARNLLLLQSELAELEFKLNAYDQEDQQTTEALQSLRNWEAYKSRHGTDSDRMKLLTQIRTTLREYREALLFESTLASIPPPDRKTLKAFRSFFFHKRPGDGDGFPMIGGHSSAIYDNPDDLVALHSSEAPDRLTKFVQNNFGFLFGEDDVHGDATASSVGYASGKKISNFISYVSTIIAALLLVGAILALYKSRSNDLKLGLIGLFTTIFAASVGLLTNAKRAEVFGATAAYAAVLVVFVSGDIGN